MSIIPKTVSLLAQMWKPTLRDLTWLLSLVVVTICPVVSAQQTYLAPEKQRIMALKIAQAYEDLAARIEPHSYDVNALAEHLGYDVDDAASFVKTQVAYDPYVGILRGPNGTLSSAAGSAWDQAGLLVSVINSMGGDAMIVRGDLSTEDATRLLAVAFEPRAAFKSVINASDIEAVFVDLVSEKTLKSVSSSQETSRTNEAETEFESQIGEVAQLLGDAMKRAGTPLADSVSPVDMIRKIADSYVWVRYRDTPNEPWKNVHPAFGSASPPEVKPIEYIADTAPQEWIHFLKIELEVERREGAKITTERVMHPYHGTVASFASHHTEVTIVPNRFPIAPKDVPAYYMPLINGSPPKGAMAFTLLGLTAPLEDAIAGPEVFATISSKLAGSLQSIASADSNSDVGLIGLIMKVTHIAPGGHERSTIRRLSDFRDSLPVDAVGELSVSMTIDVGVGVESGARELLGVLQAEARQARRLPYLSALLDDRLSLDDVAIHPAFNQPLTDIKWAGMALYSNIFEPKNSQDYVTVRTGPLVVTRTMKKRFGKTGLLKTLVDVMHNETTSLKRSGGEIGLSPQGALEQGIRETVAEHHLLNGAALTNWMTSQSLVLVTDTSALKNLVAETLLSSTHEDRLIADLESSGALLMYQGSDFEHWWKINPSTGAVLGMGVDGGQVLAEYVGELVAIGLVGFSVFLFRMGVIGCDETYANNKQMADCCIVGNLAMTWGTAAGTSAVSAYYALSTAVGAVLSIKVDLEAANNGGIVIDPICKNIVD